MSQIRVYYLHGHIVKPACRQADLQQKMLVDMAAHICLLYLKAGKEHYDIA
jgi:hypothetical protein